MKQHNLYIRDVKGDGNCLFRSIADIYDGDEDNHLNYRHVAVAYMRENPDDFAPFIDEETTFNEYLKDMQKSSEWGGHLQIQALARALKVNIIIHMRDRPIMFINCGNQFQQKKYKMYSFSISFE